MPWCDDCSRFWSPNTLPADGTCPTCGRRLGGGASVAAGGRPALDEAPDPDEPTDDYKAPWHFKLMVVLAVVYLGWRFVQLIGWLV